MYDVKWIIWYKDLSTSGTVLHMNWVSMLKSWPMVGRKFTFPKSMFTRRISESRFALKSEDTEQCVLEYQFKRHEFPELISTFTYPASLCRIRCGSKSRWREEKKTANQPPSRTPLKPIQSIWTPSVLLSKINKKGNGETATAYHPRELCANLRPENNWRNEANRVYREESGEAIWEDRSDIVCAERLSVEETTPAREWQSPLVTAHHPEMRARVLVPLKDRESRSL